QVLLLYGQGGLQIVDLVGRICSGALDALLVESEDTVHGAVEIRDDGAEILGETARGVLQEVLHRAEIAGQRAAQGVVVDRKRAIVVEIDANAGQIHEAAVSGNGIGDGAQERGLRLPQRVVRLQDAAAGTIRGDVELAVDFADHGVVSAHEIVDRRSRLRNV